jgi:hypothetical protein
VNGAEALPGFRLPSINSKAKFRKRKKEKGKDRRMGTFGLFLCA